MELAGERKKAILCAVIECYIRTGEPVGSKMIAGLLNYAVSSATIRNDMAELSALGYLEQPHTSAGRIPTAKAFRLYIDRLMPRRAVTEQHRAAIINRLQHAAGDPERLLVEATRILSETTGCVALTTSPAQTSDTVRRIECIRMSSRTVMLALMTSSGTLRSRLCCVDASMADEQLHTLCTLLTDRFGERPLREIRLAELQQLVMVMDMGGLPMTGLITGFYDLVRELVEADIRMAGQLQLIEKPDYGWEDARGLLNFLSDRDQLTAMLSGYTDGLRVLLGSESMRPELRGSSVIVTRYSPDGKKSGTIGLIGPVRMDYAEAIPQLEYMARVMEHLMAELW